MLCVFLKSFLIFTGERQEGEEGQKGRKEKEVGKNVALSSMNLNITIGNVCMWLGTIVCGQLYVVNDDCMWCNDGRLYVAKDYNCMWLGTTMVCGDGQLCVARDDCMWLWTIVCGHGHG